MSNAPIASHRFREIFGEDASRVFRITFKSGEVFRLGACRVVDPSIYSISDQWTAVLAESVDSLFRQGSGVDFVESDVVEIFDESLERRVYGS
jgi:hypothetical protein